MKLRRTYSLLACVLLLSVFVTSPAIQQQPCTPPATLAASAEPNIFNDEQEIYLGDAVAEQIQKDYRVIEDPELTSYLTRIGNRLITHLPLNKLQFQFFLVDLPDANAFVLPGGRIYVSRKLIAAVRTEDELASVIAHELGHLVAHHSAIDTTRRLKEVLGVTSVGDRRDIFEKYNQLIENVRRKPEAYKVREREGQISADQVGMFALVAASYDPQAMATFWVRTTETKGKKGNWFSDLFGTTKPEERRLREMIKLASAVPPNCRQASAATQSDDFKQWQSNVVSYTGLGRKESLHGVVAKRELNPPLRSDIFHLRFSPDGQYILAQEDTGITILTREPFAPKFRIDTHDDTYYAGFTPDSQNVVFTTSKLRVERWNIVEEKLADAKEVVLVKGCLQTQLSPDGKLLACLNPDFDLSLINVASGQAVWNKKDFFVPTYSDYLAIYGGLITRGDDSTDINLGLLNLDFTPDGRFFAAGYNGPVSLGRNDFQDVAIAIDVTAMAPVSIPDSVKKLIAGGFTFMDNGRLVGLNLSNVKKSPVVSFPSGQVLMELELWRKGIQAPTRGEYLLIRPIKDFALGVMDIQAKKITKASERPALDIFDPYFVAERRNGELGLYRLAKSELIAATLLTSPSLGRLRVTELSPDMKWVGLSGRSRGGIWNLATGEAALSLRGFQGGYLSEDDHFYGDFPKFQEAERNVAKFNLKNSEIFPGPKIEGQNARQFGKYLLVTKRAKDKEKRYGDIEFVDTATNKKIFVDYRQNVITEMLDARTMTPLWSKTHTKEAPRVWVASPHDTLALVWNVKSDAAQAEIKADARLSRQLATMKEKEGDYFVQILGAPDGKELGRLLIETGKGSFRLSSVFAAGDWVVITDTENRVLIYSLATGELKGRIFGGYVTLSQTAKRICVQNETGKLAVYDLDTLEKKDEFVFASPISMLRFSPNGQQLIVLTANQTIYILSIS
jgi:WD40 repeat protein